MNDAELRSWLGLFEIPESRDYARNLESAFSSAAFFATSALFQEWQLANKLDVHSDHGMDTTIPDISLAGIIVVSALLGLYLVGLFAMAAYASPRGRRRSIRLLFCASALDSAITFR